MIQIYSSHIIFRQNNCMIGRHFLYGMNGNRSLFIQLIQIENIPFCTHFNKFHKNVGCTGSIVYCSVVMLQGNSHCFCHRIQFKTVKLGQEKSCHPHSINHGIFSFNTYILIILPNKTHIKLCIMSHHNTALTEFFKFRQNNIDGRCICYHIVVNAGQLLNAKWYRNLRIYKF